MSDEFDDNYSAQPNTYRQYDQDHRFEFDNGLVVLPVAGTEAKHRLIRLHGGYGLRRVKWTAQRIGKPPIVPDMSDTDYDRFIGGSVTTALPRFDPMAVGYNWTVQGEYLYVQTSPRVAGVNSFPTGTYPFPISPNDSVAATIIGQNAGSFDPNADNPSDTFATALGDNTVDHDNETYYWPFTVLPPIFTNSTLIGA